MIGVGIVGEYIGRIYLESKHRPRYVFRDVITHKQISTASPFVREEGRHHGEV